MKHAANPSTFWLTTHRTLGALLVIFLLTLPLYAADPPRQLLASGYVDQAITALEQQISQNPMDAEAHNLLCRAYFMLDEWDKGIPECERATHLDPQRSLYFLWSGRIYGEKADHVKFFSAAGLAKKVRNSFERAVELNPRSWEARTDLAEFYLEAPGIVGGGKDKARDEAEAIRPLNPAMTHWVLGRLAEKNKDLQTAESEFRAEIDASHSGARARLDLAIFFRHVNRPDEMEQALKALETSPIDRAESLMDAGSLLLRTERNYPLAIRLLRRYLSSPVEEGPAFKAHELLGRILEKQGDRQAAAEQFRTALSLAQTYSRAQEDLKRVEH